MKKALIVYNPVSGWMPSKSLLFDLIHNLSEGGFLSEVYMTRKDESTTKVIGEIGGETDLIVCCGGDGTLHEVLNGILDAGLTTPLGYIPIGTTNDFGTTHGIPSEFSKAYELIKDGTVQTLDVGLFNGTEYFTYIACFGLFTKLTYGAPQSLKNSIGQFAYFLEGTKELGDLAKSYPMTVEADGKVIDGNFIFGAVVNSLNFAGIFTMPVTLDNLSDGELEVILIKMPDNLLEFQNVAGSVIASNFENESTIFMRAKKIRFTSVEPIAWNLDGEFGGMKRDVVIEVKERSLHIILNNEEETG